VTRRSTMATSTLANASSPANIGPVGPAPTMITSASITPGHYAPRPAACRKPPGAVYNKSGRYATALVAIACRRYCGFINRPASLC
jgi:hypothetical protein